VLTSLSMTRHSASSSGVHALLLPWKRKRRDIAVRRDQQPEHPVGPRLGSTRLARTRI